MQSFVIGTTGSDRRVGGSFSHTLIHDATIGFDATFPTWRTWLSAMGTEGIVPASELRMNSSLLATQAAVARQGVALGRSVVVADDLAAGGLVQPFGPSGCDVGCGYHVVHLPGALRGRAVAAFVGWLLDQRPGMVPGD